MGKKKKRQKAGTPKAADSAAFHLRFRLREGLLLLKMAVGVFLLLALVSYYPADPGWSNSVAVSTIHNLGGRVGAYLADVLLYAFGYFAYLFPVTFFYSTWLFYLHKHRIVEVMPLKLWVVGIKLLGFLLLLIDGTALLSLNLTSISSNLPFHAGGVIGHLVAMLVVQRFNEVGATLILFTLGLFGVTLFTGLSWFHLCEAIGKHLITLVQYLKRWVGDFDWNVGQWKEAVVEYCVEKLPLHRLKWSRRAAIETDAGSVPLAVADSATTELSRLSHLNPQPNTASDGKTRKIRTPRYSKSTAMPKLALLDASQSKVTSYAGAGVRSDEVEQRLADFGVQVNVKAVAPGPVVTRYELELAAGTKVSKISSLSKDLARSLSVISVRVVEVIPGKSVIGIELPNESRSMVSLQEVLASTPYKNARSPLTLGLGNDIAGYAVMADLAKMPHLLVAGTTGSGKSVCLNAMLLSLLYKSTPKQLRLILIDPKMLELSVYDGIPHLLTPVVTDMKDAATALRWCVAEMERRYRLMASLGVRNLAGYNDKVRQAIKRGAPLLDPINNNAEKELQELPQIVVIADEFADMMVVVGKKVETLIARLAQKARAAGVHLILATQRPSVDVITGLIKANIPARIAFQVSSKVDSRTILDQQGAEQLLGYGDMLYLQPGTSLPVRVHGAFVSDDEVHRVAKYLKEQAGPDYIDDILDEAASIDPSGYTDAAVGEPDAEQDVLYDEAVAFIAKSRKVSVSSIQRRFKIGYNRAARIVETMEAAGVVSKSEGFGSREVLVPPLAE